MNNLLRKHGKWILAVAGILLMLAWVMPTDMRRGGHDASVPRGTLNGKTVTNQDLFRAANSLQILREFGGRADPYRSSAAMSINMLFRELDPRDPPLHLFLLLSEAKHYGIAATKDEVAAQIRELNMTEAEIRNYLDQMRTRPAALQAAIADMLVVQKLTNFSWSSLLPSEPEILSAAEKSMARVQVDFIAFDARRAADKIGEPTAEQIQQHFDKYKTNLAGQAPDKFPFGYKYPDRAKVEYLVVDRKAVRASMNPTREDVIAAAEYYRTHLSEYTKEPSTQPATQNGKGATTQASTQPVVQPFEEVRSQLIEAQIGRRVDDLVRKIAREITTLSSEASRRAEAGAGSATQSAPKLSNYEQIANELQKRFNVRVTYYAPGPWLSAEELAKYPGIGESYLIVQNQPVATFATAVLSVKELEPANAPQVLKNIKVGSDLPPLMDQSGNMYITRVIAADKSHVPPTVDEVKPAVVADLKKLMTYDRYQNEAQQLVKAAQSKGLADAAGKQKVTSTPLFSRESPMVRQTMFGPQETGQYELTDIAGVGRVPEFLDAAFSLLQIDGEHKVTSTGSPARMTVYALELKDSRPVAPAVLVSAQTRSRLLRDARTETIQAFIPKWNNLQAAAQRVNFVPSVPFKEAVEE